MKELFEEIKLDVVLFETEDVITTSGNDLGEGGDDYGDLG